MADPATRMSAPAATIAAALSTFTPPSTSSSTKWPVRSIMARACLIFSRTRAMNRWPPKPGLTDMINNRSTSGRISSTLVSGVAGFRVTPAYSFLLDGLDRAVQVRTGFDMDCEIGRARFGELPDEGVRVGHHQVDVERQGNDLAEGFDDGRSDGQVRDEVAVHDIHVHQVRASLLDGGDLVS